MGNLLHLNKNLATREDINQLRTAEWLDSGERIILLIGLLLLLLKTCIVL